MDVIKENIERMDSGNPSIGEQGKKIAQGRRLILVLEEMEKMKTPTYELDLPMLKKRCRHYEPLLYFFGHNQAPEDISFYIDMPEAYEKDREKLAEVGRAIFDNIKYATTRSILLESVEDFTKEERAVSSSNDKEKRGGKERALEKLNIVLAKQKQALTDHISDRPESEESIKPTKHKSTVRFRDEVMEVEPDSNLLTANPISDAPGPWARRVTGSSQQSIPAKLSAVENNNSTNPTKLLKLSAEDATELNKATSAFSKFRS